MSLLTIVILSMQVVNKFFAEFDHRVFSSIATPVMPHPIGRMDIFNDIYATFIKVFKQESETGYLIRRVMRAVVYHNIGPACFFYHHRQQIRIRLIADKSECW